MHPVKKLLFLLIFLPLYSHELPAQNFSGGFSFNMPANDTTSGAFLPQFPAKPITGSDFVTINSDGSFAVNGKPIRFWGTNFVGNASFPDKHKSYYIAGRMRKLGINLVRFHYLDYPMNIRGLLYGSTTTRQLNLTNFDYLDKLISELKKNGIYVNINLNVGRVFRNSDGVADADSIQHYAKGFTIFDPQMIELQKEYARQVLTHVNPYTGLSLAEDPVMAMVELINENSLYLMWRQNQLKIFAEGGILPVRYNKMLDTMFNSFLLRKYGSTENLQSAWSSNMPAADSANLIINGDFENRSFSNWVMELHGGAVASISRETINPYQGKAAAKVTVSIVTGTDWHTQFEQTGFSLKKDSLYLVEFAVRADSSRTIAASVMRNNSPYNGYGGKEFRISDKWQICSFLIRATEDNIAQSRFTVSFKNSKGIFWFDNVKIRKAEAKGLLAGETLENKTVRRISYNDAYTYSDQRVKDISGFYIKLHDDFYSEMKDYLKDQLKVKVPILGTNFNTGPGDLISQAKYDYLDNHGYWQHPEFPGVPWSQTDWTIDNTPMVKAADGGTMSSLFNGIAMLGKPFTVSEYSHAFPNRYQTEKMLFTTAYLSFHNADAIEYFDYNSTLDFETDFIAKHFDNSRNPALMSLYPSCALAYRNRYISGANETIKVRYSPDFVYSLPKSKPNSWGITFYPKTLALIHAVRNESFTAVSTTDFSQLPPAPVSPYKSDTGEIILDTQGGILTVNTPRFIGAAGFLNADPGIKAGIMEIGSSNEFGTVTWVSLTGDSLVSAGKSLITVSSRAQNSGMIWDGTTTVHNDWGHAPTEMFPLTLKLKLNIIADSIRISALNVYGNQMSHTLKTYYPVSADMFEVTLDQNAAKSPWFGVERYSNRTTALNNEPAAPSDFRLDQNYPNPFNSTTTIKYYVPHESHIKIDIFDALGRRVKSLFDQKQSRGIYSITWEGKDDQNANVPSGVYFLSMRSGRYNEVKKLVVLK